MNKINDVDMIKNIFTIFNVRRPEKVIVEEGKITFQDKTGKVSIKQEIFPKEELDSGYE